MEQKAKPWRAEKLSRKVVTGSGEGNWETEGQRTKMQLLWINKFTDLGCSIKTIIYDIASHARHLLRDFRYTYHKKGKGKRSNYVR
jgi:hypothetical protein